MNVQHILAFVIFSLFFEANLLAQDTPEPRKHSIHIEAFGRSLLWASLNYEYKISQRFSLGTGFGFTNLQNTELMRDNDGVMESGRNNELRSSQLLYGNYFIGKEKHNLVLTAGITHFWILSHRRFDSGNETLSDNQFRWNFGAGYQYNKNDLFFRCTAYVMEMPRPNGIFPKVFPWLGISGGFRF